MGTMSAPALRKRFEFPAAFTVMLRSVEQLTGYESPLVQAAVIVLAAAMTSVIGAALLRLLAGTLTQS